MELAESWRNDLTLWPGAGDAVLYRSNAGRAFTDTFYLALADFCRNAAFSAGFFAAHSVASSWIGPRAPRAKDRPRHFIFSAIIWGPVSPGR